MKNLENVYETRKRVGRPYSDVRNITQKSLISLYEKEFCVLRDLAKKANLSLPKLMKTFLEDEEINNLLTKKVSELENEELLRIKNEELLKAEKKFNPVRLWLKKCELGEVPEEYNPLINKKEEFIRNVYNQYLNWAKNEGIERPFPLTKFGMEMRKHVEKRKKLHGYVYNFNTYQNISKKEDE